MWRYTWALPALVSADFSTDRGASSSDYIAGRWGVTEDDSARDKIHIDAVYCDGQQYMYIDLRYERSDSRGSINLKDWRRCGGDDTRDADAGFLWTPEASDTAGARTGTLRLNPYRCAGNPTPAFDADTGAYSTGAVTFEFSTFSELSIPGGSTIDTFFGTYHIAVQCTFQDTYFVESKPGEKFDVTKQVSELTTAEFSFVSDNFMLTLDAPHIGSGGNAGYRANDVIQGWIDFKRYDEYTVTRQGQYVSNDITLPGVGHNTFAKLHDEMEFAPIQCTINSLAGEASEGESMQLFNVDGSQNGMNFNSACGLMMLHWELDSTDTHTYDHNGTTHNRVRGWEFKYIAFVWAADDGVAQYELGCTLKICNSRDNTSGCKKAKDCLGL